MGEEGGFEFEDSEGYRKGDDKLTIKSIILKQLSKCLTEGSKEMTRGGTVKKIVGGKPIEEMIPNQREVFINSVEMLKIPLLKKFKQYCEKKTDNDIKTIFESTEKELGVLKEEHSRARQIIISTKLKNDKGGQVNNLLGSLYNECELAKVEIYKKFLMAISYLLDEENYFEEESAIGGLT